MPKHQRIVISDIEETPKNGHYITNTQYRRIQALFALLSCMVAILVLRPHKK